MMDRAKRFHLVNCSRMTLWRCAGKSLRRLLAIGLQKIVKTSEAFGFTIKDGGYGLIS